MSERHRLEGRKLLIVDDEPDVIETLKEVLKGCDVRGATSFEEGEKLLKREHFDIAILDIMGVNGYELLEIAKRRNTISVMLTAHAFSPEHAVKSFKMGAASYIPKEEIEGIESFLEDILEAQEKGKHFWWRWLDRLAAVFEKNFGEEWQKTDRDFWKTFLQ